MNAHVKTNVIAFRPLASAAALRPRPVPAKPVLRATWCVSRETGRLECRWTEGEAAVPGYSRAA